MGVYHFTAARFVAFFDCASENAAEVLARSAHHCYPVPTDCAWARCAYDQLLESVRRHPVRGGRGGGHKACA